MDVRVDSARKRSRRLVVVASVLAQLAWWGCGIFGLTACGGPPLILPWGFVSLVALGLALRADASLLERGARFGREMTLALSGVLVGLTVCIVAMDLLGRPPAVDVSPELRREARRPEAGQLAGLTRCRD